MPAQLRSLFALLFAAVAALSGTASPTAAQGPPTPPPQPPLSQRLQPILRARFPPGGEPPVLASDDGPFRAAGGVACFYDRRQYAPAWASGHGTWGDVEDLLAALGDASLDGLDSERYHLADLRRRVAQVSHPTPGDLAELDLRLTDAFLRLAADLRYGAVNPELIYDDCELDLPEVDLGAVLESALAAQRIRPALAELAPVHAGYSRLKGALAQYRALVAAGGWPRVPDGPPLRLGARSERAAALRQRLIATGDYVPEPMQALPAEPGSPAAPIVDPDRDLFDPALQTALRAFQERHGLDADGAIGKGTLAALNVPVEQRIRQVEINLDRWRWLPRDLGDRYIMVNIAGFSLELVENGNPALAMRVVAGKPTTRTPMFSGRMVNVVLNPYWNVPAKLVKNEVLPHAARDPGYLAKEGFEVTRNGGSVEVRQKPGPKNALGQVKFLFPNRFDVYLHDTPSRSLFSRTVRSFSHGCIRIEKPIALAEYLLKDDPAWTPKKIAAVLAKGKETWVTIPKPLPVHLVYWTAWVDGAGKLQLRDDLYGRDKPLGEGLGLPEAPVAAAAGAAPQATRRPL
jgi:murein L,D-transpeptidase YcbB/YkuD